MNKITTTIIAIVVIATGAATVVGFTNVYANQAADPPQQPTAHFEDPANPNSYDVGKVEASPNALPLYCATLEADDPVPEGCINDVPEDFPPSLLPPK